jgi:hypothetical protein
MRNAYTVLVGKPAENNCLRDLRADGRTISNIIVIKV